MSESNSKTLDSLETAKRGDRASRPGGSEDGAGATQTQKVIVIGAGAKEEQSPKARPSGQNGDELVNLFQKVESIGEGSTNTRPITVAAPANKGDKQAVQQLKTIKIKVLHDSASPTPLAPPKVSAAPKTSAHSKTEQPDSESSETLLSEQEVSTLDWVPPADSEKNASFWNERNADPNTKQAQTPRYSAI